MVHVWIFQVWRTALGLALTFYSVRNKVSFLFHCIYTSLADLPSNLKGFSCLSLPSLWRSVRITVTFFYAQAEVGSGGPGPYICKLSALIIEPSPQPHSPALSPSVRSLGISGWWFSCLFCFLCDLFSHSLLWWFWEKLLELKCSRVFKGWRRPLCSTIGATRTQTTTSWREWQGSQAYLYIYFLHKSCWDAQKAPASQMTRELEENIKHM